MYWLMMVNDVSFVIKTCVAGWNFCDYICNRYGE
jgi:hypothetical protein